VSWGAGSGADGVVVQWGGDAGFILLQNRGDRPDFSVDVYGGTFRDGLFFSAVVRGRLLDVGIHPIGSHRNAGDRKECNPMPRGKHIVCCLLSELGLPIQNATQ